MSMRRLVQMLTKKRIILRGTIFEYVVAALIYFLVSLFLTKFVAFDINNSIFNSPGDSTNGLMWLNFSDPGLDPMSTKASMANYPYGDTAGGVVLLTHAVYWPLTRLFSLLFGWVAGMNIMMYIAYMSLAMSGYLVSKRITGNKVLSFFVGYATAFVPYLLKKSIGHFSYIFTAFIPLSIGAFYAFWQRPTTKKAIVLAMLLASGFYVDGYVMLASILLASSLLVSGAIFDLCQKGKATLLLGKLRYIGVTVAVFVVCVIPLFIVQYVYSAELKETLVQNRGGDNIEQEMQAYKTKFIDLYLPLPNQVIAKKFIPDFDHLNAVKNERSNQSESANYISILSRIVVPIGAIYVTVTSLARKFGKGKSFSRRFARHERHLLILLTIFTLVGGLVTLSFMFSPGSHGIALPGSLLANYSISFWRVMSRLFVLLNPIMVIATAVYIWMFTRLLLGGVKFNERYWIGSIVFVVFTVFYAAENYVEIIPWKFSSVPAIYQNVKKDPTIKSVALLPFVDPLDNRTISYFTDQMTYVRPLVNDKEPTIGRTTNILGGVDNPEAINLILDRRIDAVFLDTAQQCPQSFDWGYLDASQRFEKHYKDKAQDTNYICLYRTNKHMPTRTDPVFVNFIKGINPSPNAPDQSQMVFKEGVRADFELVTKDLTSIYVGNVTLSMDVHYLSKTTGDYWEITDGEKVVGFGEISPDTPAHVDINLESTKKNPVFHIEIKNHMHTINDTGLGRVVVSKIEASAASASVNG